MSATPVPRRGRDVLGARAGRILVLGASGLLVAAGCAAGATPAPTPASTPAPTPRPTVSPTPTESPGPAAAAPAGTTFVEVPDAGILLPIPDGWRSVAAADLADPAVGADLATYPGAGALLAAIGDLGGWASLASLAVDPSPASRAAPLASNISVLVSQPSVGGSLLDFVAGMIGSSIADVLGADPPESEHVKLPVGEAVRLRYVVPASAGPEVGAVSWVIGAPGGTLLVTFMGTTAALADLDPEAIAGAITPVEGGQ